MKTTPHSLINKDSSNVEHFESYQELLKAAEEFFSHGFGYPPSSFEERKKVDGGMVYAIHTQEDSACDHFYGFIPKIESEIYIL